MNYLPKKLEFYPHLRRRILKSLQEEEKGQVTSFYSPVLIFLGHIVLPLSISLIVHLSVQNITGNLNISLFLQKLYITV